MATMNAPLMWIKILSVLILLSLKIVLNIAVLNGTVDYHRKYDFMVRVGDKSGCSGILIARLWVLTDADCIKFTSKIYGGGYGEEEQVRYIRDIYLSDEFVVRPHINDLAVARLDLEFIPQQSIAVLSRWRWSGKSRVCRHVGYGKLPTGINTYKLASEVSYADLEFGRNMDSCGCISGKKIGDPICYKTTEGQGPCFDKGGALICDGVVKGLLTFSQVTECYYEDQTHVFPDDTNNCGSEGVIYYYNDIGKYISWIEWKIGFFAELRSSSAIAQTRTVYYSILLVLILTMVTLL